MNLRPALLTIAAMLVGGIAQANDLESEDVRGKTYCYPAKQAAKTIKQLGTLKPEQRDIVAINIAPRFLIYDGGSLPEGFYVTKNDVNTSFTITSDGQVPDFVEKVLAADKSADLCIHDPARAGLSTDDESLYFEMGLTPFFNNTTGRHTIAELEEGTKDGKSHYKKMVPSAVRAFMPDTKYFHVKYFPADTAPDLYAETENGLEPISGEYYNEGYVISLKQLEDCKATALIVKGGSYKLAPVPSIKTMKRFGVGKPRGPQKDVAQAN